MEGSDDSPRPRLDPEPWVPMPACAFRQQLAYLAREYQLLEQDNLMLREQLSTVGTDSHLLDETDLSTALCSYEEASQSFEVELPTEPRKLCVQALHGAYPSDMEDKGHDPRQGHRPLITQSHSKFAAEQFARPRELDSVAWVTRCTEANSRQLLVAHSEGMKDGSMQRVARHPAFESVSYMVIALNGLWIAIDADYNKEALLVNSDAVFQIVEHTFCVYFVAELLVRFLAFKIKTETLKDVWFMFDLFLVFVTVLETWVLTAVVLIATTSIYAAGTHGSNAAVLRLARILRIARMARIVRLLRAVPGLVILLRGVAATMHSAFFTLVKTRRAGVFPELGLDEDERRKNVKGDVVKMVEDRLHCGPRIEVTE